MFGLSNSLEFLFDLTYSNIGYKKYIKAINKRNIPWILVNTSLLFENNPSPNIKTKIVIPIRKGRFCFIVDFSNFSGFNIATAPRISSKLHILLPITFPTNISVLPVVEEIIVTTSSGREVPKATIVRPIKISWILSYFAIQLAPFTKVSAPNINKANPKIKIKNWTNIKIPLL